MISTNDIYENITAHFTIFILEPPLLNPIHEHVLLGENPTIIRRIDLGVSEKERQVLELQYASYLCLIPLRVETVPIGLMILGDE